MATSYHVEVQSNGKTDEFAKAGYDLVRTIVKVALGYAYVNKIRRLKKPSETGKKKKRAESYGKESWRGHCQETAPSHEHLTARLNRMILLDYD